MTNEEAVLAAVKAGELEIDGEGRIWRIAARRGDRWTGATRTIPCARRRAENATGLGYLQVRVMVARKRHHALAHRVIYMHFKGEIPAGMTVNHENGERADNRPSNLTLATPSEQKLHSIRVLGCRPERNFRRSTG